MGIDWKRFGTELKRRREKAGMTQDLLAATIGVRLATIGRLEIGDRRPSFDLLERLAKALRCRVRDLLPEEESMTAVASEREPSLKGAPTFFRASVMEAQAGGEAGYDGAGWTMGGALADLLSEEAYEELGAVCEEADVDVFKRKLLTLLEGELPGCMALVPSRRRNVLLLGVAQAIAEGRLDWFSSAAERIAEDAKEEAAMRRRLR